MRLDEAADGILEIEPRLAATVTSWLGGMRESVRAEEWPGEVEHVGEVTQVADGVAAASGLPRARFNELLRFPGELYGLVFNLDLDRIGCVLLGDDTELAAGDGVRATGRVAVVPVGEGLLGRVVDAMGRPIDGEGTIEFEREDPIESEAARILDRAPVEEQLVTGITAIDALIPIGRGQRELVVGDRATGKTAIAVDMMLSQRKSDVICIYVAIGQKVSTVKRVVRSLVDNGVMRQTIVVSADADDSPGLQFVAPYSAATMAEYFMEQGRDVLVIYDDLTRHARAYREISLLLRRPPGREAFPGDIFFIHARLLERSTRLSKALGGGSFTAIPIVETQAKNLSAYIPTNLISITDGQIFLDGDLFYKGMKPAVHVGKSVSRVGGKTQLPAIRRLAKELRLEYAQFAELEIFTRFGATVEKETQRKIERGRRIREILKQPRLDPLRAAEEALILLSVDSGVIDEVPLGEIGAFKKAMRFEIPPENSELMEKIDGAADLDDGEWETLLAAVKKVAGDFAEAAPVENPDVDTEDAADEKPQSEAQETHAEPAADRKTD